MSIHIFFSLFLFAACQSELSELTRAKEQYAQGAKLEALQMYEDIITRYPDHPSAKEAKILLEEMYFEAAQAAASKDPLSAYRIAQKQLQMFPDGANSKDIKKFLTDIQPMALAFQEKEKKAAELCTKAKSTRDVVLWREYIQEYPDGRCIRQAKDEIRELDKKRCSDARKGNPALWLAYLEDFPEGGCHKEAKTKSVRKELTSEDRSALEGHIKECSRLAEKCPRLHERFVDLIRKKETDYLRGSYYAYLNNWLAAYEEAGKQSMAELERLRNEGFNTSPLGDKVTKTCEQACAQNQKELSDLRSCVLAFDEQSPERWNEYVQTFPEGACSSIARP